MTSDIYSLISGSCLVPFLQYMRHDILLATGIDLVDRWILCPLHTTSKLGGEYPKFIFKVLLRKQKINNIYLREIKPYLIICFFLFVAVLSFSWCNNKKKTLPFRFYAGELLFN